MHIDTGVCVLREWREGDIETLPVIANDADVAQFLSDRFPLETAVYAPNQASMRVLEKCGYSREGVMRSAVCKNGSFYDALLYSCVKSRV